MNLISCRILFVRLILVVVQKEHAIFLVSLVFSQKILIFSQYFKLVLVLIFMILFVFPFIFIISIYISIYKISTCVLFKIHEIDKCLPICREQECRKTKLNKMVSKNFQFRGLTWLPKNGNNHNDSKEFAKIMEKIEYFGHF